MRRLLLAAIVAYQRWLSPHKGFSCAYRAHMGRASCSALGHRAIRRHGVLAGVAILRQRLHLCGVTHRRLSTVRRPPLAQRGDCDLGCDLPCDGDDCLRVSRWADCCDLGCGRDRRKQKKRR